MDAIARIRCDRSGSAARIVVQDRETRNAMGFEMWDVLIDTLDALARDEAISVAILTGAPAGTFISGGNIKEMRRMAPADQARYHAKATEAQRALAAFPKLLVAAIDGPCFGGGVSLASYADLRLATARSRFCIPAARLGLAYPAETTERIVALVGPARAKEMLLTARIYSAGEALPIGLVDAVGEDLGAMTAELVERVAGLAPLSLRHMKRIVNVVAAARAALAPAEAAELAALSEACKASDDHREGLAAFLEKRPAVFRGR